MCGNPACENWFESPNQKRLFCSYRCRLQVFYECRRPAEDAVALSRATRWVTMHMDTAETRCSAGERWARACKATGERPPDRGRR